MDVKGTLSHLAGRVLRPLRSGEHKLAGQHIDANENIAVESASFPSGKLIPPAYVGEHGRSPALRWTNTPPGTQEIVVLCEDPDAPTPQPFVHWIVTGLSPETSELPEGLPPSATPLLDGAIQGRNSMGKDGYFGPWPPPGHGVHHYHFQVFALDERLDLAAPIERDQLVDRMRDHVLALGEVVGLFKR